MANPVRADIAMPGLNGNLGMLATPQGYTGVKDNRQDPIRNSLKVDSKKLQEQWSIAIRGRERSNVSSASKNQLNFRQNVINE